LHHCDLSRCVPEVVRVAKPGAFVLIDELYTHRLLQSIRESRLGRWLHPKVIPIIYQTNDTYTTADERKLTDLDLSVVRAQLSNATVRYYSMVVNRFLPSWDLAAKADRILLKLLGRLGYFVAGRFILTGFIPQMTSMR
jgi:hypothetical protein